MIALALLFAAIGTADLFRSPDRDGKVSSIIRAIVAGLVVLALCVWGLGSASWWVIGAGVAVALVLWVIATSGMVFPKMVRPWPVLFLTLLVAATFLFTSSFPSAGGVLTRWYATEHLAVSVLHMVSFGEFAVLLGFGIFLISSANVIVRLVLIWAGVPASKSSLKGGRMIGSLERIFIFALALANQYVAIGAIIAAKGILRYPEVSARTPAQPTRAAWHFGRRTAPSADADADPEADQPPTNSRAEYVLIGSMVSWFIALALIPLLR